MSKTRINRDEMEKMLQEILDKNISTADFQEITEQSLENDEFDKVNAMLLEHYKKSDKTGDFEERVKLILKAKVGNEAISKLENDEKQIDEQSKEIEGADAETIEKAKEEIEEKNKSGEENIDFRAELMKQVYIEVFKEYSNTLYNMKMKQIGKDELTVGDKEGTELVLYENYLKNLEKNYNGYASLHKDVKEKILSEYPEVKEQKEEICKKIGRETDLSRERIEKKMNEIDDLYKERRAVAKKIEELSLEENYDKQQIDEYQKKYLELTYRIRDIEPSLEDYTIQMETEKKNHEFAKEYGIDGELIVGTPKYGDKGERDRNKDGIEDEIEKRVKESGNDEVEITAKHIYDLINNAEIQINQGRFDEARELMDQVRTELGIEKNAQEEARDEKSRDTNEEVDKNIDKENDKANENINGKYITNLNEKDSWKSSTLKDESIEKKDKLFDELDELNDKFKETYPEYWNDKLKEKELVKQKM